MAATSLTPPRLIACYFAEAGHAQDWARMAGVLTYTAEQHCRTWDRRIAVIPRNRPPLQSGPPSFQSNTQKLKHWSHEVQTAADGDRLLLVDADVAILRPLDSLWGIDFDIAYTVRQNFPHPFNAGVVALRVSEGTRRFMRDWVGENDLLLKDRRYSKPWRTKYGGVNQAAFGHLLESLNGRGVRLVGLPCREWNCEDSAWHLFDPAVTRILHVKGMLRIQMLGHDIPVGPLAAAAAVWRQLDQHTRRFEMARV